MFVITENIMKRPVYEVQRFDEGCCVQHPVVTLGTILKMETEVIYETSERLSLMSLRTVIYVVFHFVFEKGASM
jgi:hypothetical protein